MSFKVTVLGSGTSTGVPIVGCRCHVCNSSDPKDKRLRASLLIQSGHVQVLIDSGPDFRTQMLRQSIDEVDAVLYTHFHYDHLGGLDDLRPFSQKRSMGLDIYCNEQTYEEILIKYPYLKKEAGNHDLPILHLKKFRGSLEAGYEVHQFKDISIRPIRLLHVLPDKVYSVGFVVNSKFGYLTDFRVINEVDKKYLQSLEVLYIGAPLSHFHPTHCTHGEARRYIKEFDAKRGVIGHLAHSYLHSEMEKKWAGRAEPAYDGQVFEF